MKGHMENGKFHPHTEYKKGIRKSRDQFAKLQGIKLKDKKTCSICRDPFTPSHQSAETRNVCKKCIKVLSPDERKARVITGSKLKDVNLSEHNWGFETSGGKISKLRLGNWSDAGWHWDGDEDDIIGYLVRVNRSKIDEEFIEGMEGLGITFNKLKPLLLSKVKSGSWLYEISGDNTRWHFHQDIDEGAMVNEELEGAEESGHYTENDLEKIGEELWNISYSYDFEEFEKDYGDGLKDEVRDMIKDSNNYKEFFEKMDDEDFTYQINENYVLGAEEKVREAVFEAVEKLKKEGKISVTKKEELEMKAERTEGQIYQGKQARLKR